MILLLRVFTTDGIWNMEFNLYFFHRDKLYVHAVNISVHYSMKWISLDSIETIIIMMTDNISPNIKQTENQKVLMNLTHLRSNQIQFNSNPIWHESTVVHVLNDDYVWARVQL